MAIFEGMSRAELESHAAFHKRHLAEIASGSQPDEWGTTRMMWEAALAAVEEELEKLDQRPAASILEEPSAMMTIGAFSAILSERAAQQARWGTQRHPFPVWVTILTEETGEFAQAVLKAREAAYEASDDYEGPQSLAWLGQQRAEAVQCAAVAVAIVEHLDELLISAAD